MKRPTLLPIVALLTALSCTAFDSPRDRARKAVEEISEKGVELSLPSSATIEIPRGGIEVLAMDAYQEERGRLAGFCQLSIDGKVGDISVSYLGNEKVEFSCGARSCSLVGELAPRFVGVVDALVRRKRAVEDRNVVALAALAERPGPLDADAVAAASERTVAGWYIRVESDTAIVGEADEERAQRRMLLRLGADGWKFVGGLL